jgi:hypothetical protein
MYPPQSLRQTVLTIKEVLAVRGVWSGKPLCGRSGPDLGDQGSARAARYGHVHGNQPDCRLPVAGQDNFITGFGTADEVSQMRFGGTYRDFHMGYQP